MNYPRWIERIALYYGISLHEAVALVVSRDIDRIRSSETDFDADPTNERRLCGGRADQRIKLLR